MISWAQFDAGMTSLFTTIIVDHTILFVGTVLLFLTLLCFREVFSHGDFSKLKKFFY